MLLRVITGRSIGAPIRTAVPGRTPAYASVRGATATEVPFLFGVATLRRPPDVRERDVGGGSCLALILPLF